MGKQARCPVWPHALSLPGNLHRRPTARPLAAPRRGPPSCRRCPPAPPERDAPADQPPSAASPAADGTRAFLGRLTLTGRMHCVAVALVRCGVRGAVALAADCNRAAASAARGPGLPGWAGCWFAGRSSGVSLAATSTLLDRSSRATISLRVPNWSAQPSPASACQTSSWRCRDD